MAPDNGDASMSHHCCDSGALPTLVAYLAETCSTSCGGGSTGVETIAGPCRGSGMLQEACGELGGAIINLPLIQQCTNKYLPSIAALWLPDSLRLARALSTSYFGTGMFLQDMFGLSFQFKAAGSWA